VCTFLLATFVSEREICVCVCIFVSYVCERESQLRVCVFVCVCVLVARRYEISWRDFVRSCWHNLPEAEFAAAFEAAF